MNINFIIALLIVLFFALSFVMFKCNDFEFMKQIGGESVGGSISHGIRSGIGGGVGTNIIGGEVISSINNINSILNV